MSVHVQYRYYHRRDNYIVHVNDNVTFWFFSPNIFYLSLFESSDVEPADTEGWLYIEFSSIFHPAFPNVDILQSDSTIVKTKQLSSLQSRAGTSAGRQQIPQQNKSLLFVWYVGIPHETLFKQMIWLQEI